VHSAKDNPSASKALVRYRWPLAVVGLGAMGLVAFLVFLWFTRQAYRDTWSGGARAGRYVADKVETIAARFLTGRITQTFESALPELVPAGRGNLELATLEQLEVFRAEDERSVFWETLSLGKTVSEIRVPVTYRYHLRLADSWRLEVSGQTCIVYAPGLRPSLPPAIHTDRMEKKSESGWARFNAREQMEALEKSITPTLNAYAMDRRRVSLVREPCRQAVAEFVKTWLLKEEHWRTDRFRAVKVIFAGEAGRASAPADLPPTLELK
jgi:hypothetical protein